MNESIVKGAYRSPPTQGIVATGITIIPGEVVTIESPSIYTNLFSAEKWGGLYPRIIAVEDMYLKKSIDDPYISGSNCWIAYVCSGTVVTAWLETGNIIACGDLLKGSTDGKLVPITDVADNCICFGIANESCDSTSGPTRVDVIIL